jgi:bifunctional UDP-N-acetylglucosamine pyrophosphorylase / glucosamine-1-phosphate N-acetyltransferase
MKIVILAAGKSTRFKSNKHKALHDFLGQSILERVKQTLINLKPDFMQFVLGHQISALSAFLKPEQREFFIEQKEQLGTAHALQAALKADSFVNLPENENINLLITCIDTPLLTTETLQNLIDSVKLEKAEIGILTAQIDNPEGYGRIVKSASGSIQSIREEKDCNETERKIKEINGGVYYFNLSFERLKEGLASIKNTNVQKEYYLTDLIEWTIKSDLKVISYICENSAEILGINSRTDLEKAIQAASQQQVQKLMFEGVTFLDRNSVLISPETEIGSDTVIWPNCQLIGKVNIGSESNIGPNTFIQNSEIGSNCSVRQSNLVEVKVASNCSVGPFANLRPQTILDAGVLVGDFVEVKNSFIGKNSKVSHLSYIGDCTLGEEVNIGAGTITANYNALNGTKSKTIIGDKVKVGSNCVFVAPVQIADNCLVAAGSTITENVENPNSLIIARSKQTIKENWVK